MKIILSVPAEEVVEPAAFQTEPGSGALRAAAGLRSERRYPNQTVRPLFIGYDDGGGGGGGRSQRCVSEARLSARPSSWTELAEPMIGSLPDLQEPKPEHPRGREEIVSGPPSCRTEREPRAESETGSCWFCWFRTVKLPGTGSACSRSPGSSGWVGPDCRPHKDQLVQGQAAG